MECLSAEESTPPNPLKGENVLSSADRPKKRFMNDVEAYIAGLESPQRELMGFLHQLITAYPEEALHEVLREALVLGENVPNNVRKKR